MFVYTARQDAAADSLPRQIVEKLAFSFSFCERTDDAGRATRGEVEIFLASLALASLVLYIHSRYDDDNRISPCTDV